MSTLLRTISMYFIQLLVDAKVAFYRNVVASMDGKPAFPTPPVTLPDFTTQIDLVETRAASVTAARTALTQSESELQEAVDELDTMGRSVAAYVLSASMNDVPTIESSGFRVNPPRQPVGPLSAPGNLRAYPGQEGTCVLKWDRERGGISWIAQCAPQASGPWTTIYNGTRAQCVATNLTSGAQYWFRVQVLGSAGPSDWSNPTTKRAA
jgi:hypothetical protein